MICLYKVTSGSAGALRQSPDPPVGVGRAKVLRYGQWRRKPYLDDKAVTDEFVTRHTLGRHPVLPKPPLDVRAVCGACAQPYFRPPGKPGDRLVPSTCNVASRNVLRTSAC